MGGALVLAADGTKAVDLRHELLGLAGELMSMNGAERVAIQVLFDQDTPARARSRHPASVGPELAA
jgi:hypothetical protein